MRLAHLIKDDHPSEYGYTKALCGTSWGGGRENDKNFFYIRSVFLRSFVNEQHEIRKACPKCVKILKPSGIGRVKTIKI